MYTDYCSTHNANCSPTLKSDGERERGGDEERHNPCHICVYSNTIIKLQRQLSKGQLHAVVSITVVSHKAAVYARQHTDVSKSFFYLVKLSALWMLKTNCSWKNSFRSLEVSWVKFTDESFGGILPNFQCHKKLSAKCQSTFASW